jgi:hypothetical protein
MNTVSIMLATEYDSIPSHCTVHVCGELIFDSVVSRNIELTKEIDRFEQFTVKVVKSGKTMDLVNKHHKQELVVQRITLNGIDLKVREFGRFELKNNPYVKEETLQTDRLSLNGEWLLELPRRSLVGHLDIGRLQGEELRDDIGDCDIACFGCSQTWGSSLEYEESWPSQLQKITGRSVKNLGVGGSNNNEIMAFADYYINNYKSDVILIYLPHSYRRQLIMDGKVLNLSTVSEKNRELLLNGEEHSIASLSGELYERLENMSKKSKVYFGTYQTTEDNLYRKTPLKKYMFPFLQGDNYPKASDNLHHGAEFNREFAKMLVDFLSTA